MKEIEAIKCLMNNTTCHLDEPRTMAINALKKQIPKKLVSIRKIKQFDGYDMGNCPVCGEPLDNSFYENLKYCFVCGQAIDWSD